MYLETGKVRAGTPRLRPPAHPGVALEILDFKTYQRKYQFWRHFQIRLRLLRGKLPRVAIMTRQTWTTAHTVRGCLAKVSIFFNIYQWFCEQQNAYLITQKCKKLHSQNFHENQWCSQSRRESRNMRFRHTIDDTEKLLCKGGALSLSFSYDLHLQSEHGIFDSKYNVLSLSRKLSPRNERVCPENINGNNAF